MKPATAIFLLAAAALAAPQAAFAASDLQQEGGYIEDLGWASIAAGAAANIPFLLHKKVKKFSVASIGGGHEITRDLALQHHPILNFHMGMNLVGFAAGMIHGMLLAGRIDAVSFSLALLMAVMTATGIILRFSKLPPGAKMMGRMVHSQMVLSGLLVALAWLHVLTQG